MIRFLDGPAAGVTLVLRRAPLLLRVVSRAPARGDRDLFGGLAWDALDQLGDEPRAGETIHVYLRVGDVTKGFLDWHDGRGRRGTAFCSTDYRHVAEQPGDSHTRTKAAWRAWCVAHEAGLRAQIGGDAC